ncbi:MAG: quinone oxidoreductase [Bacillati bacterium ANGP1]|uniref:Quinone oxidoreductase n=1 Tax=Candidatus Segetimicrobium genomatis TaxID=2569760 RepID=A0A537J409_9BACT|nr:MAG: quinone oxidoreductase [Terrabacteria group bacterium ANGP1]
MKAIRVHATGGPEVLRFEEVPTPTPGRGEALVKIEAAGVNFTDIYYRLGWTKAALPFTAGVEAAGTVATVGPEVSGLEPGERVVYTGPLGAYAEQAVVPAWRLVRVPRGIDARTAAAAMLQGMTAHYLSHSTYPLKAGHTALVHAAAGGVGLLLVQMAKMLGARVIGTVSTEAKARLARDAGADEVIDYTQADFEAEVKRLTGGRGVQVVYDSVGKTTFDKSLNCLAPRGYLFLTRPTLGNYTATPDELNARAGDVLGWVAAGRLRLRIERTFRLAEAAEAQRLLASRGTTGKLLLVPA